MKNWLAKLLGIGGVLWEFLRPLIFGAGAEALEELLPHAESVVESLADSPQSGEEKRAAAVDALKKVAVAAGVAAGTAVINLAVEMAVAKMRAKV